MKNETRIGDIKMTARYGQQSFLLYLLFVMRLFMVMVVMVLILNDKMLHSIMSVVKT